MGSPCRVPLVGLRKPINEERKGGDRGIFKDKVAKGRIKTMVNNDSF